MGACRFEEEAERWKACLLREENVKREGWVALGGDMGRGAKERMQDAVTPSDVQVCAWLLGILF